MTICDRGDFKREKEGENCRFEIYCVWLFLVGENIMIEDGMQQTR